MHSHIELDMVEQFIIIHLCHSDKLGWIQSISFCIKQVEGDKFEAEMSDLNCHVTSDISAPLAAVIKQWVSPNKYMLRAKRMFVADCWSLDKRGLLI